MNILGEFLPSPAVTNLDVERSFYGGRPLNVFD